MFWFISFTIKTSSWFFI